MEGPLGQTKTSSRSILHGLLSVGSFQGKPPVAAMVRRPNEAIKGGRYLRLLVAPCGYDVPLRYPEHGVGVTRAFGRYGVPAGFDAQRSSESCSFGRGMESEKKKADGQQRLRFLQRGQGWANAANKLQGEVNHAKIANNLWRTSSSDAPVSRKMHHSVAHETRQILEYYHANADNMWYPPWHPHEQQIPHPLAVSQSPCGYAAVF